MYKKMTYILASTLSKHYCTRDNLLVPAQSYVISARLLPNLGQIAKLNYRAKNPNLTISISKFLFYFLSLISMEKNKIWYKVFYNNILTKKSDF